MARVRRVFRCRSCGGAQARWAGKCPDCGEWDSLEEESLESGAHRDPQRGVVEAWESLREGDDVAGVRAVPVSEIAGNEGTAARIASGIGELDRVLGGGLVPGSTVLIGGEPGIGKSTLLLQAAGGMAAAGSRVLYVSSEESAEQVRLRADRLGLAEQAELFVLSDTNLARIVEQTRRVSPSAVAIDSIQMVYLGDMAAPPGSVTQLRRCASDLVFLAKATGIAVVLVGHVTKDGQLAGPRLLEHVVDVVLGFEGDRSHAHRVVRAIKNRFGTTLEIGLFEMGGEGLAERPEGALGALAAGHASRPGSVVCPVVHGTRCMLVEVQALTATGFLGAAKRKASGVDSNRLAMLIAVLEQHAGMRLADRDVFASSVGGVRVAEPASDLALLLAIAGSERRRGLPTGTCAVGEVGLGGEVRAAAHFEQRLREAMRRGFACAIVPRESAGAGPSGISLIGVRDVGQALEHLSETPASL
ncbi:MAG: DNA repair protein RadA [Phycisphaeraceae bacterium]|nr:DNA repair protein RadA [Phycisphaeraceae bacterium]